MHSISLATILFGLWLLLSGHYVPLLLTVGLLSVGLAVFIAVRMDVIDHETVRHMVRYHLLGFRYWPWLAAEVVKANLDVARRVVSRGPDISPRLVRLKVSQKSDLAKVIYANSITLTPGTVTVDIDEDEFVVHALTREAAEALQGGEMDRRVHDLERGV